MPNQPTNWPAGISRALVPTTHVIFHLVAGVVGNPTSSQSSPLAFFPRTFSSIPSEMTSFFCWSLASSRTIFLFLGGHLALDPPTGRLECGIAVLKQNLLPGVDLVGLDAVLVAQVRDGDLVDGVPLWGRLPSG